MSQEYQKLIPKWISVKDELPPLEKHVLAYDGREIEKAFREPDTMHERGWFWTHYDYMEWNNVTHWMPLPEPPKYE